jgi:EpsI family protein
LEHYPRQSQDAELVNSQNLLVEELSNWRQVEDTTVAVPNTDGLATVKQARLHSSNTNLIVWSWYHLAGKNTVNDYLGKLYGVYGKVQKGDESATGVILFMEYDDTVEQQQQNLSAFSALLVPWLGDSK